MKTKLILLALIQSTAWANLQGLYQKTHDIAPTGHLVATPKTQSWTLQLADEQGVFKLEAPEGICELGFAVKEFSQRRTKFSMLRKNLDLTEESSGLCVTVPGFEPNVELATWGQIDQNSNVRIFFRRYDGKVVGSLWKNLEE